MKTRQQSTMGFTVGIAGVPETIEEATQVYDGVANVLDYANNEAVFRGWLPSFRDGLVERLEKDAPDGVGIKREVIGKGPKPAKGEAPDIFEKDTKFIARLRATVPIETLNKIAAEVAAGLKFDPSDSSPSAGRVAKRFTTAAESIKGAVDSGQTTWETFIANFSGEYPNFEFQYEEDGATPTVDSIATALKYDEQQTAAKKLSKFTGKAA